MKLFLCILCSDIVTLKHDKRSCTCGVTSGYYTDELNAIVTGIKNKFMVLGFSNGSLISALSSQLREGDSSEKMIYAGKKVAKGRRFEAFIIPESSPTVKMVYKNAIT